MNYLQHLQIIENIKNYINNSLTQEQISLVLTALNKGGYIIHKKEEINEDNQVLPLKTNVRTTFFNGEVKLDLENFSYINIDREIIISGKDINDLKRKLKKYKL